MRLSAPVFQLKRRARVLARNESIPLHRALDRVAREEGFAAWSLLANRLVAHEPAPPLLSRLACGDMLLIGARPGHGKTLLGLRLLLDAAREGRRAVIFTLEHTEREILERIRSLDCDGSPFLPEIVTSDEIDADFIVRYMLGADRGCLSVIDYLQILDQRRSKLPLSDQLKALRAFANKTGVTLGFISQIDRSFDPERAPVPDLKDIRLPNPIPAGIFTKAFFLHSGEIRFQHLKPASGDAP